jgi:hypothetical protein
MSTLASTLLTLAMLAAFALVIGGVSIWRKHGDTKRGVLMILAALVLFGNVLIWTV